MHYHGLFDCSKDYFNSYWREFRSRVILYCIEKEKYEDDIKGGGDKVTS